MPHWHLHDNETVIVTKLWHLALASENVALPWPSTDRELLVLIAIVCQAWWRYVSLTRSRIDRAMQLVLNSAPAGWSLAGCVGIHSG